MCGWELMAAARYRRDNPKSLLFVDTHSDFINSARGPVSKWGLHYFYYRPIVHRVLPWVEKILCVSALTEDFARDFYGIPDEKLEFYPLGGRPIPDAELKERRAATREAYGIGKDEILFVQSGKQSPRKYLIEALCAFAEQPDPRFRLLVAGMLMDEISDDAHRMIASDPRVLFVGWKDPNELESILCAADVYLQPGSQSSTMQTSLCCGCAVILENLKSHKPYVSDNGWLIDSPLELNEIFHRISQRPADLYGMGRRSLEFARTRLDYKHLAERILPNG
jgi:glycosyltransferase involved in cell wall biosynthesis